MRKLLLLLSLVVSSYLLFAQQPITGKVVDAKTGAPLAGVSIRVKSTKKGVSTDNDGHFTLSARSGDILEISIIGYTSQNYSLTEASGITIALEPASTELKEIVFVGNRGAGRAKTETPVPVDVIKIGQVGLSSAKMDLSSQLNMLAPSFNYNKQSGGDGADAIDLATLRGLGPDQTLVLINGKRRHQTAFVALFGTRGRGNSGTDLNAIPEASIDRVEILRDGASAQYGSDAIAGVINIILKKDINHLNVTAGYGSYYDHKYNSLNNVQPSQYVTGHQLDGQTFTLGLDYGLALGKRGGFINFAGNFLTQGKTFRQEPDTNLTTNPVALPVNTGRRANGDASVTSGGIMFNAELPSAGKTTFYSFGGYNYKNSNAYAYSRNFSGTINSPGEQNLVRFPTDANGNLVFVPGIMHKVDPSGPTVTDPSVIGSANDIYFNPIEDVHITDASLALGFKSKTDNNWNWDLSNTFGVNNFHYYGDKTFNASLDAAGATKTHFDDGGFYFFQNTVNLDIDKHFKNIAQGMTLSFGAEYRFEQYGIYKGELASYATIDTSTFYYPSSPNPSKKAGGAQGFPGYRPSDEVVANRSNIAFYADADLDITDKWLVDGAVRLENYTDFGFVNTYKLATRYKIAPTFNLRGSVSTGFRAPSLQQINFSYVESNVQAGVISLVNILPNTSPITRAAGIPDLKQEKSVNGSLGFSWKPIRDLLVTADGYLVKIKNRVVLSGEFSASDNTLDPAIINALNSQGIQNAQFFANAVNTTNIGLDVVVDYTKHMGKNTFKASLAGNFQHLTIDKINVPSKLNDNDDHRQAFFSDREQLFVKASAPPAKINLALEYDINKFGIGTHLTYFGEIKLLGYGGTVTLDDGSKTVPELFDYKAKTVTDLYADYSFSKKITLYLGADNLFNVHPSFGYVPGARLSAFDGETGGPWDAVQMGFNGLRLFTKLAINL